MHKKYKLKYTNISQQTEFAPVTWNVRSILKIVNNEIWISSDVKSFWILDETLLLD